jgi:hypothetical protein
MTDLNAQEARATVRVDKVSHFFGEAVRATRCCSTTASRLKRVTMSRPPRSTKTPAGSWSICLRSVSNSRILGSRTPRFCPVQPHNPRRREHVPTQLPRPFGRRRSRRTERFEAGLAQHDRLRRATERLGRFEQGGGDSRSRSSTWSWRPTPPGSSSVNTFVTP